MALKNAPTLYRNYVLWVKTRAIDIKGFQPFQAKK
jgi:hypothetical protein